MEETRMDGASQRVVDRQASIDWFRETRQRTAGMFDLLTEEAYYEQPIPLRHPVVFYEGHIPAFSVNTLIKRGLGREGLDEDLERLFARGIDPEDQTSADATALRSWPTRETVRQYAADADQAILDALDHAEIERDGDPVLHRGQAVFALIEHEELHQETLAYMWHRLPMSRKRRPADATVLIDGTVPDRRRVEIPAGRATLGAMPDEIPFGWDNEFPRLWVEVPAFAIDAHNVTNQQYLEFIEAGGYTNPEWWSDPDWAWRTGAGVEHPPFWFRQAGEWFWRGMFELIPLPPSWPVYVSQAEASAYARWKGLRLPTEAEFHRAAFGTPDGGERAHPWGRGATGRDPGQLRVPALGAGAGRVVPHGGERVGGARSDGQRLGVDLDGVRGVSGVQADGLLSGVLRRFLRRAALRDQGSVAGDCHRAGSPQSAQLVPAPLSVCLCRVPLCGGLVSRVRNSLT